MKTQNQIKRKLSEPTSIEYICGLLESKEIPHRSALASIVCEQFAFYDARGQAQRAGCLLSNFNFYNLVCQEKVTLKIEPGGPGVPLRVRAGVRKRKEHPSMGLKKGDVAAFVCTNRVEIVEIYCSNLSRSHPP